MLRRTHRRYTLPWYVARLAATMAADPVESFYRARTRLIAWARPSEPYHAHAIDHAWRRTLGAALGLDERGDFAELWAAVRRSPELAGLRIGPQTFGVWNDGDPALLEAAWRLARHLRPSNVVETGVARGLTSRIVLEALHRNGAGHLWSIDLPPALDRHQANEIGIAVPQRLKDRWTYIAGASRRRLPRLLSRLGAIDLFIHDSMHTDDNVRFELDLAWEALRPGGAMIVDDVDLNRAFHDFTQRTPAMLALVCRSEPLEPDVSPLRYENTGLFGVIVKRG
jgi:hypothetical protein